MLMKLRSQRQEVDTQMPNKIWSAAIIDYKHESLFFWDLLSDGVIETADMPWRREAAQFAISCDWQLKTEIQVRPFFLFFKKNLIVLFSFPCMGKCPSCPRNGYRIPLGAIMYIITIVCEILGIPVSAVVSFLVFSLSELNLWIQRKNNDTLRI